MSRPKPTYPDYEPANVARLALTLHDHDIRVHVRPRYTATARARLAEAAEAIIREDTAHINISAGPWIADMRRALLDA